jgi:hypothetical protein
MGMPYGGGVNERTALAIIDRDHGSLEDFVISLLGEKRAALDENLPLVQRAEMVGLPLPVFARVLASPQFRALLRVDLVNLAFTLGGELEHIQRVSGIARGERKRVMSASGAFGDVDQAPADIIAAGKYLNELRGTPIEKGATNAPSVVINIGRPDAVGGVSAEVTIDADVVPYRPQRAGGLPPSGARIGSMAAVPGNTLPQSQVDAGLGTLYGVGAEEADEDHALVEKQRRGEVGADGSERTSGGDELGDSTRRKRFWSRNWPGRGIVPARAYPDQE